jgi:hypothetical protein
VIYQTIGDYKERPRRCPTCGTYPCMDGTGCVGQRQNVGTVWLVVGAATAMADSLRGRVAREKMMRELEHPRFQNRTPRSPKPSFRKGRR